LYNVFVPNGLQIYYILTIKKIQATARIRLHIVKAQMDAFFYAWWLLFVFFCSFCIFVAYSNIENTISMKKIPCRAWLLLIALVFSVAAHADWRFGLHASYDNTGATVEFEDEKAGTRNISGFSVGPVITYEFLDYFSVQTGVDFLMNGFATLDKSMILDVPYEVEDVLFLYYLQVPLYAVGQLPIRGDEATLLLEVGPNFACGVYDELISTLHVPGVTPMEENYQNVAFGNLLSRFNVSMHVGIGAEYMGARLMVGYNFGLYNLSLPDDYKIHSGGFTLSVGYLF
jgi:hypothetical protein